MIKIFSLRLTWFAVLRVGNKWGKELQNFFSLRIGCHHMAAATTLFVPTMAQYRVWGAAVVVEQFVEVID